jgi:hypothetical protein
MTLPYTRRKLNARFVHNLKKLCGGIFHLHVDEVFANEEFGDYVYVLNVGNNPDLKKRVFGLCKKYGIGSDYIDCYEYVPEGENDKVEGEFIQVYLSKPKPYAPSMAEATKLG